jgi:histidine triad (HIT) family protein
MEKCIFCEIAAKRIPSKIVYEDGTCMAFLDINPRSKGMTIVAAKRHYTDPAEEVQKSVRVFKAAIAVEKAIRKALSPIDVSLAVLPSSTGHFHIRVYPVYKDKMPIGEAQPIKTNEEELNDVVMKIRAAGVEVEEEAAQIVEEKVEEKKEEKKKEEEEPKEVMNYDEIEYLRRESESG